MGLIDDQRSNDFNRLSGTATKAVGVRKDDSGSDPEPDVERREQI